MVTNSDFNFAAYAERVAEMTGCCPLYTGTRGAQPGVKRFDDSLGLQISCT